MPTQKPTLIEVNPSIHKRIKTLAKSTDGANIRSTTNALLDSSLSRHESGEDTLKPLQVVETQKGKEQA